MECQASESKKLFQVFDASKRKRGRKKRDGAEGRSIARSVASEDSASGQIRVVSAKASLQETFPSKTDALPSHDERNADSSPSLSHVPSSPRRHRRPTRDNMSLALKGGLVSTPRSFSHSPPREDEGTFESVPQDQGSFIYAFLEEAIKRDKKKQRHARRHEDRDKRSRARASTPCEQRDRRDHRERRDEQDERDHRDERNHLDERGHRDDRDLREHRDHRDHRDHRRHRRRDDSPKEPEKNLRQYATTLNILVSDEYFDHIGSSPSDSVTTVSRPSKVESPVPVIDQNALIETFAKLCATFNTKTENSPSKSVQRSLSHKSLQCEVVSRQINDVDQRPVKLTSHETSQGNVPVSIVRSQEDNCGRLRSRDNVAASRSHLVQERGRSAYCVPSDKENTIGEQPQQREQYRSKLDVTGSKMHNAADDRRREYAPRPVATRSVLNQSYRCYREHNPNVDPLRECDYRREADREYNRDRELNRDYDRVIEPNRERCYDDEKKRYYRAEKTSRSYDVHRDVNNLEDDRLHRTARSDNHRDRRYDERRYEDKRQCVELEKRDKFFEDKPFVSHDRNYHMFKESRDRRSKKNLERFERASVTSRDEEYKDRFSERERDSGLSVADGESTASARSNYLRLVKQEIMEQREAMDKMMHLWKELMRCFRSYSQTSGEKAVTESAANSARDSAAAQLRLWRECMRRYETVARDVGDTDARLMEEINKQRSEMAEMATMWQECLQRYREMSNDFNNLKQKLAAPAPASPVLVPPVCAEGEGAAPVASFCQPAFPPPMVPAGYAGGSPVRARASAPTPPPWWWSDQGHARAPPARRSSPESRGSCDRDRDRDRERERERRRHKDRERDDSKYKDKSKPTAARSEHRRRKR